MSKPKNKWMPPGGWLAIVGHLVLAIAVAIALHGVQANQERTSKEICRQQNELRQSMIDVFEGQLPPISVPENAGPELKAAVSASNQRDEQLVETFKEEMKPLNCKEVE